MRHYPAHTNVKQLSTRNTSAVTAECAAFYRGYGTEEADAQTLAYYRYERIVEDTAMYCDELLLGAQGGGDRALSLRYFADQFRPNDVIDIAERTYAALQV
jgi:spectinomycin phosphotransferase